AGAIVAALDDEAPSVRFAAAVAAGQAGIPQARPKLVRLLDDPDARVHPGAIFGLHMLGQKQYSRRLEQLARDNDPGVRGNVAFVLGLMNEPTAVNPLRGMQSDLSPLVRIQAAEALWAYGDDRGKDVLMGYSISRFADDQMDALWALSASPNVRVLPLLRGKLTDDYPEIGLTAARALGRLGMDDGYGVAVAHARAKEPLRRMLAALAFGEIGRLDAQPHLAPLLGDTDPRVRLAAATAVLRLNR
ncbi:MAG: HEAT repeat domain-containing protein, partial [Phycisphaerae bacterium]